MVWRTGTGFEVVETILGKETQTMTLAFDGRRYGYVVVR